MGAVRVGRGEWRWAAGFAAVVMAVTAVPYLVAVAAQTPAWRFGGFLVGVDDSNTYLAKMGQAARGAWLFTPAYTSEPAPGVWLYSFYFLLGKLAGPDSAWRLLAFHLARLLAGLLALLVSYRFLAEFLPFPRQRRLGLWLTALGGGLGWLTVVAGVPRLMGELPLDFYSPEAYTFLSLYTLPHLATSRALFLLGMLAYLRGRAGWAGLAWLGVSLIQPIHVLTAWAIVGVDWLLGWRSVGRWPAARRAAAAIGLSAPMVLYTVAVFAFEPVLSAWNRQSQLPAAHPVHYLLGYGLWALPGLAGWRVLRRQPRLARWCLAWGLAVLALILWPVPIQRRLLEGAQLPLVILAVLGATVIFRQARRWLTPALAAASSGTAVFLLAGGLWVAARPAPPVFQAADQLAVLGWVAAQPAAVGGVGLGAYNTGNLIPAYTPLRAYLGLTTETVAFSTKDAQVTAFYQVATADADRLALLAAGRITYVFHGPAERALGDFDPARAPFLRLAFAAGDYAVYEVHR
ncbi:MAG: hypothetical protein JNK29_11935 [Anaerolineales bacterium]|nr:hypothetical protein [Anaerolineales bacterium]